MAVILTACGGGSGSSSTPSGRGAAPTGGTLRLGMLGGTGSLNLFGGLQGEYGTFTNIFPTLVAYDLKTLDYKPNFAASWDQSADHATWTFHTRHGAQWSDGQVLTAKDFAFTLSTIVKFQQGPTASYSGYVTHLKTAEASDPDTLVLHYEQGVGNVLAQAGTVQTIPEHVWAQYATGDGSNLKTFTNTPSPGSPVVSGGPFMLVEQRKDEFELFKTNPNYYGAKPSIDGFGIKFFASDDALVNALKAGDIDAIQGVPATAAAPLKSAGLTVSNVPGINYTSLTINSNQKRTNHRELLQPQVRQAFEAAVDRSRVVQVVSLGFAQPGTTILSPAMGKWRDTGVQAAPFDVAAANQLLDQAGTTRGVDGLRQTGGHPMAYDVLIQPQDDRTFQIVRAGLQQVGVKLTAKMLDRKAQNAAIQAPDGKYLDFDLAIGSGTSGGYDPDFGLSAFACFALGLFNRTGYCDPAYDKLYQEQGVATPDQRVQLVHTMQRMLADSRTPIVLQYPDHIDAWSSHWTGFVQSPDGIFTYLTPETLRQVHMTG